MGMNCDEKSLPSNYFTSISLSPTHRRRRTRMFVLRTAENDIVMKEDVDCSLSVPPYARFLITGRPTPTVPARLVWTNTFILVEVASSIKTLKTPLRIETVERRTLPQLCRTWTTGEATLQKVRFTFNVIASITAARIQHRNGALQHPSLNVKSRKGHQMLRRRR